VDKNISYVITSRYLLIWVRRVEAEMEKKDVDVCIGIVTSLSSCSSIEEQDKQRNKLFTYLQPTIIQWMQFILKTKTFYPEEELKALSWDCFLFCLNYYKPEKNIPLLNHFFAYTKFFLLIKEKEKAIDKNKVDPTKEEYDLSVFEVLDDLKNFKQSLPEEYKSIFDDTLMSMSKANKNRVRRLKETSVKYHQYHESKKIFRLVIDFLLRR